MTADGITTAADLFGMLDGMAAHRMPDHITDSPDFEDDKEELEVDENWSYDIKRQNDLDDRSDELNETLTDIASHQS